MKKTYLHDEIALTEGRALAHRIGRAYAGLLQLIMLRGFTAEQADAILGTYVRLDLVAVQFDGSFKVVHPDLFSFMSLTVAWCNLHNALALARGQSTVQ